jgi:hypothetical protein
MHDARTIPRLTTRPLPKYSYVPGMWPHPQSDPAGHSYGHHDEPPEPLTEENWQANAAWLWGIELFNHGYYWEAHEAWEGLWHAAGQRGATAELLKGLIKLAAAGVKAREGNLDGVRRHAARASELFAPSRGTVQFGLRVDELLAAAAELSRNASQLVDTTRIEVIRVLPLTLRLVASERYRRG